MKLFSYTKTQQRITTKNDTKENERKITNKEKLEKM